MRMSTLSRNGGASPFEDVLIRESSDLIEEADTKEPRKPSDAAPSMRRDAHFSAHNASRSHLTPHCECQYREGL